MAPIDAWPAVPTLGGVWVIWKARKPLRRILDIMDSLDALPAFMARTDKRLQQLENNGGSTVKDAIDRIDTRVEQLEKFAAASDEDADRVHNDHEGRLARLEGSDEI